MRRQREDGARVFYSQLLHRLTLVHAHYYAAQCFKTDGVDLFFADTVSGAHI